MLSLVRKLGDVVIETERFSEEDVLTQRWKLRNTRRVICVIFEKTGQSLTYQGVHIEDYDTRCADRYLYRTFAHGRYDVTPTAVITSVDKTKKRWAMWFGEYSEIYNDDELLGPLRAEYKRKEDTVFQEVSRVYDKLRREERRGCIITIKIREAGSERYLGEFEVFRRMLKEEALRKFYARGSRKNETVSKGEGVCYLCGNETEVWGFGSPFSVYTLDKKGFAPSFAVQDAWKMLPTCRNCVLSCVAGKEFLDVHLRKRFYGIEFYVIPNFFLRSITGELIKDAKARKEKVYAKSLLGEEDDITEMLKEESAGVGLTFVFFKVKQKDFFDILKYVEDVPPSWIRRLYAAYDRVGERALFQEEALKRLLGDDWVGDFPAAAWKGKRVLYTSLGGLVREFFPGRFGPASEQTGIYDKYFVDIIGDILSGRSASRGIFIKAFIRMMRTAHTSDNEWLEKLLAVKSLFLLLFLYEAGLIKGESMSHKEKVGKNQVSMFFEEYEEAFDTADKRVAFLEGVLIKFLLDVQYANLDSTPFRVKLRGLRLDEKKLKSLLPEAVQKLREYEVAYPWLEQEVAKTFLEADKSGWTIPKDEVSYYFALGLCLGRLFKEKEAEGDEA